MFFWALPIGAGAGLVGGIYRRALDSIERLRELLHHAPLSEPPSALVSVVAAAALVGMALWLVRRFAPEAAGSGVQEIEGALDGARPLRWRRVLPVKFAGGLLALGGGLALGREGPTIQMGGNLGKLAGDLFRIDAESVHVLVAAGAGAGLAAAFNAPFAGILFVVEEMRPQFRYSVISVQTVIIACAVADIVVRLVAGGALAIEMAPVAAPPTAALWLFPILGVLFALVGLAFNGLLVGALERTRRGTTAGQVAIGVVIGGLIGLAGWSDPYWIGDGHSVTERALHGGLPLLTLTGLFVVRFGITILSYASGAPGGIFAPMLALGTLLGMGFGELAQAALPQLVEAPGVFAVAGMGALFAATVRAPLTGMMLAVELTAGYDQILPLMLTCVPATILAHWLGGRPLYTVLLERTLERAHRAGDTDSS